MLLKTKITKDRNILCNSEKVC
uniref:Uncharacterized protein n=1 Tax=Vitis vinifera TaxID=29760 RepID=F6I2M4_VITVI